MALIGLISDIHSNYAALEAVLAHAKQQQVEVYWCLGDVVGYGPQPARCLHKMLELKANGQLPVWIMGNHDAAFLGLDRLASKLFKKSALRAIELNQLHLDNNYKELKEELSPEDYRLVQEWCKGEFKSLPREPKIIWQKPSNLEAVQRAEQPSDPLTVDSWPYVVVHGSPTGPLSAYLYPHAHFSQFLGMVAAYNLVKEELKARVINPKLLPAFQLAVQKTTLVSGHTHWQYLGCLEPFTEEPHDRSDYSLAAQYCTVKIFDDASLTPPQSFRPLDEFYGEPLPLGPGLSLINPGSVGQSRDGDTRPSYAILDNVARTVRFYRVDDYDKEITLRYMEKPTYPEDLIYLIRHGTVAPPQ